jgi:predicted nucleotidyltransferase
MIDLHPNEAAIVTAILAAHVPREWEVWAFGSRVTGRAQPYSDLDLAVSTTSAIDWREIERLKDAFADSDLPFSVDVVDLGRAAPAFVQRIRNEGVQWRHAGKKSA